MTMKFARMTSLRALGALALLAMSASLVPAQDAAAPSAATSPAPTLAAGGTVKGTIKWEGKEPKNPLVDMASDPVCKGLHEGQEVRKETTVVNGNGTLNGVVLYIAEGLPKQDWPVKPGTITLDQKGCTYVPHVVAIQVGQKVEIRNSDKTTHNVHFKSKFNGDWNKTQAEVGTIPADSDMKRAELGTAFFKCDIHTWMESRVAVFDHPFFDVTREDGTFTIPNLPAGEYTLAAWHEKEKEQKIKITVTEGGTVEQNFSFGKK